MKCSSKNKVEFVKADDSFAFREWIDDYNHLRLDKEQKLDYETIGAIR